MHIMLSAADRQRTSEVMYKFCTFYSNKILSYFSSSVFLFLFNHNNFGNRMVSELPGIPLSHIKEELFQALINEN